jgi:replicative DNA helicase
MSGPSVAAFDPRQSAPAQDDATYRTVPHNLDAEQALLGAILVNNDAYFRVSDFLEPGHFHEALHGRIYESLKRLVGQGKTATPITLKTEFDNEAPIGDLSVPAYLARLATAATTIINAEGYGRLIHDLALRRSLIGIGEDMVNTAYDAPIDYGPKDQIEQAERNLFEIAEADKYGAGFVRFVEATTAALDMAANAYQRDGRLAGIATGLRDLDEMMGGLQPSDLIILAGRPGMGKTSLATNIAFSIAGNHRSETTADGREKTTNGGVVGFFSLEMSAEQLATRILSEQAEISSEEIRRGKINERQFNDLVETAAKIERIPLYIDATGGLAIAQLTARARRLKRQQGLDVMVVDYIQLLQGSSRRSSENRVQEITEITTNLKALAKELHVPIIALSQLSRQVESRDDKRPQLSDLRESGSIEQDADVVLFVYREEYYLKNKMPKEGTEEFIAWQNAMDEAHGKAEVIIGKQRHGPTGTVFLQFTGEFTRFDDLQSPNRLPREME